MMEIYAYCLDKHIKHVYMLTRLGTGNLGWRYLIRMDDPPEGAVSLPLLYTRKNVGDLQFPTVREFFPEDLDLR